MQLHLHLMKEKLRLIKENCNDCATNTDNIDNIFDNNINNDIYKSIFDDDNDSAFRNRKDNLYDTPSSC